MILRLRRKRIIAVEVEPKHGESGLPRCPPIPGSLLTLELTYTNRPIERLLERGLLELGFTARTWNTGPREYRTRFDGEWSDQAIEMIQTAIPAIGATGELEHHPV